jgi:hypothetical protein
MLVRSFSAAFVLLPSLLTTFVHAQPSPDLQTRISAAITAAVNQSGTPDYTAFVNPFIGTGTWQFCVPAAIVQPKYTIPFSDNFGDVWYVHF